MNTQNKILPIVIGTITMTMISSIPILNLINVFCCAGIIAGGFVGVYTYWKQLQNTGIMLNTKDGGMIGILCGILSAIFVTGFGVLISLFSDINPMIDVIKAFDEMGVQMPPEIIQYLEKFSDEFNQHGFSPTITVFSFICNLIIYPLFGSIGSLIGVSILNKKNNQTV